MTGESAICVSLFGIKKTYHVGSYQHEDKYSLPMRGKDDYVQVDDYVRVESIEILGADKDGISMKITENHRNGLKSVVTLSYAGKYVIVYSDETLGELNPDFLARRSSRVRRAETETSE